MAVNDTEERSFLEGRHAVSEALKMRRTIDKIYLLRNFGEDSDLSAIRSLARSAGVPVVEADRRKLDFMSETGAHQGVIASVPAAAYVSVEEILRRAEESGEPPLIVLCDNLSDPHNLGAIIRTAGAVGAHGVIIPKHRSVSLTAVCAKAAAGALEHVPVAKVTNLSETIVQLQKQGIWVFGTAGEGTTSLYDADFVRPAAIVIGSEGDGMSRLVRDRCDYIVSIPMKGAVPSLNASAAAAVVLFEAMRRRMGR